MCAFLFQYFLSFVKDYTEQPWSEFSCLFLLLHTPNKLLKHCYCGLRPLQHIYASCTHTHTHKQNHHWHCNFYTSFHINIYNLFSIQLCRLFSPKMCIICLIHKSRIHECIPISVRILRFGWWCSFIEFYELTGREKNAKHSQVASYRIWPLIKYISVLRC